MFLPSEGNILFTFNEKQAFFLYIHTYTKVKPFSCTVETNYFLRNWGTIFTFHKKKHTPLPTRYQLVTGQPLTMTYTVHSATK